METLLPSIVALLSTGGLLGGIVMLLKLRPEAGQIIVTQAQGAVVVQSSIIKDLVDENERLKEDNRKLKGRVASLEDKVKELERKVGGS